MSDFTDIVEFGADTIPDVIADYVFNWAACKGYTITGGEGAFNPKKILVSGYNIFSCYQNRTRTTTYPMWSTYVSLMHCKKFETCRQKVIHWSRITKHCCYFDVFCCRGCMGDFFFSVPPTNYKTVGDLIRDLEHTVEFISQYEMLKSSMKFKFNAGIM